MKRFWYEKPFTFGTMNRLKPVWHGSCEGNQCTRVIGLPFTGHIVYRLKRNICFGYSKKYSRSDIILRMNDRSDASLNAHYLGDGIIAYYGNGGELSWVEVVARDKPHWRFDKRANMGYLTFDGGSSDIHHHSNEISPQIIFDYNNRGQLYGIEIFGNRIEDENADPSYEEEE